MSLLFSKKWRSTAITACVIVFFTFQLPKNAVAEDKNSSASINEHTCKNINFGEFVAIFTESSDIQKRFTRYPLIEMVLDENDEPSYIKTPKEKIKFPIIENNLERKNQGLTLEITKQGERISELKVKVEDTDYLILYTFEKTDCWRLIKKENWSL